MKPSEALAAHRAEIRRLVEVNRASNPRVFGSVSRSEDTEERDLDLLVDTIGRDLAPLEALVPALRHELGGAGP